MHRMHSHHCILIRHVDVFLACAVHMLMILFVGVSTWIAPLRQKGLSTGAGFSLASMDKLIHETILPIFSEVSTDT